MGEIFHDVHLRPQAAARAAQRVTWLDAAGRGEDRAHGPGAFIDVIPLVDVARPFIENVDPRALPPYRAAARIDRRLTIALQALDRMQQLRPPGDPRDRATEPTALRCFKDVQECLDGDPRPGRNGRLPLANRFAVEMDAARDDMLRMQDGKAQASVELSLRQLETIYDEVVHQDAKGAHLYPAVASAKPVRLHEDRGAPAAAAAAPHAGAAAAAVGAPSGGSAAAAAADARLGGGDQATGGAHRGREGHSPA